MNIAKMVLLQKDLDEVINKNHPIGLNENRTANKITALVVELAEFANEARFFKYWSEDTEPRTEVRHYARNSGKYLPNYITTNPMLEEYVDSVHFFLSVAIDKGWEKALYVPEENLIKLDEKGFPGGITEAYNGVIYNLMKSQYEGNAKYKGEHYRSSENFFNEAWFLFMAIGQVGYGFTEEDIEAAYILKNEENHSRQNNNY